MPFQAIYYAQAIARHAVALVRSIFCHMDMEAYSQSASARGTTFERSRVKSKRGVQAITGGDHPCFCLPAAFSAQGANKALVLAHACFDGSRAIAIRDFVGQAGADASLLHGIRNDIQAAINGVRAGVMIDDAGCTVADGIDHKYFGAGTSILQR